MNFPGFPNPEEFVIRECEFAGDKCFLVYPNHIGAKWTKDNLIFRSSIWTENGEPVSLSFKKFFNYGEQPNLISDPTSLKGGVAIEKVDGSTLIVSRYKGKSIVRTRGTIDATILDNGYEIDYLRAKYPNAFDHFCINDGDGTLIYEWTTPNNRIVLDYGDEPLLHLVGYIWHKDYSYASQETLDNMAPFLNVKRPKTYNFNTLPELVSTVEVLKDFEGVCLYYNRGQDIKKLKTLDYLAKHAFKSEMSDKNVLDLYIAKGYPTFSAFYNSIEQEFDYEIAEYAKPFISRVCDAYKEFYEFLQHMMEFVRPLYHLPRKEAAEKIFSAYGKTDRSGLAFALLDGKVIDDRAIKKILLQIMAKR